MLVTLTNAFIMPPPMAEFIPMAEACEPERKLDVSPIIWAFTPVASGPMPKFDMLPLMPPADDIEDAPIMPPMPDIWSIPPIPDI